MRTGVQIKLGRLDFTQPIFDQAPPLRFGVNAAVNAVQSAVYAIKSCLHFCFGRHGCLHMRKSLSHRSS